MPIKVVDRSSGEYIEIQYDGWTEFAQKYDEVTQQIKALERAKEKMRQQLLLHLGDDNNLDAGGGYRFEIQERPHLNYDVDTLRKFLDEDFIFGMVRADKKKVQEALNDPNMWQDYEAAKRAVKENMLAERESTKAVVLIKGS